MVFLLAKPPAPKASPVIRAAAIPEASTVKIVTRSFSNLTHLTDGQHCGDQFDG